MPHPKHVPLITNAVLGLVAVAVVVLLLGLPVEDVLSGTGNPVSRVAVVTFAMALVGIVSLAFSIHLLLSRHKRIETEFAEMRRLVETSVTKTDALAASADSLEGRLDAALERMEDEMAAERERMRAQVRAYTKGGDAR